MAAGSLSQRGDDANRTLGTWWNLVQASGEGEAAESPRGALDTLISCEHAPPTQGRLTFSLAEELVLLMADPSVDIGNRPSPVSQLGASGTLGYAVSEERCLGQRHSRWWGRARICQLRTVQKPGTPQTLGFLFCLMRMVFRMG